MSGDDSHASAASTTDDPGTAAHDHLGFSRWWLIVAAAGSMGVVSPYQYVWSSIEGPLARDLGIALPALGLVFTLFVIFQAGSQFPVGWWRDRHGPRNLTAIAAVLAGGGYIGITYATTVWHLYVLYSLGAIGVGIVYTVAVNTALKWFPDRRGLTTGVGTMAFAGGAALFVPFVRANAAVDAYSRVLRLMGVLIFVVVLLTAVLLRDPPPNWFRDSKESNEAPADQASAANFQYTWRETARTWQFWLMYAMFVAVSGAGLMVTAKVISFAQAMSLTENTATLSATMLPVAAGIGRLVMGDLSDRFDRRYIMAVSFALCGIGVGSLVFAAQAGSTVLFVGSVVLATFFWSPQYTLFPSLVGEYYGEAHSSSNYALLYSGKMWGGIFGGAVAGWLVTVTSWTFTFGIGAVLAIGAGVSALALQRPTKHPVRPAGSAVNPGEKQD
ncbi:MULTISPECIES: OFA family MFS transporter [Halorubrum]|uniref:MFS transporter, OFA family, oxalate/formate antiporter n=1 Tax=Halorubrum sodomense TaxID=35743 RepID=A0A1I6H1R5_HALSD|nr:MULTISPECIES: OFA family MFS transporter [Halorubrum]TKX68489.1 MFS transporter [Halorubrum sp. SP9]SFR48281.1 MFS transporter, OFA family, oxalate/formate antiporter [Halorubrum sodomense]